MKDRAIRSVILMFLVLAVTGCGSSAPQAYTPSFPYTPSATQKGSDTSIALIRASTVPAGMPAGTPATPQPAGNVAQFLEAITRAVEQNLSAHGFKLAGPYDKMDDMTFPQKKQAELAIQIISHVVVTGPNGSLARSAWSGAVSANFEGPCTLSGFVEILAWEPLSAQKVWSKRVEMPAATEDCTGEGRQALSNGEAHLLEKAFSETMQKADAYFSPDEIELVRKQSQELREKKVY